MDYQSFQPGGQNQNSIPPVSMESIPQKTITPKLIGVIVGLLVLGATAYGGIRYWQNQQVAQEVVPTFTTRADATADWKTYTNTQYGFEFKYPGDFQIQSEIYDQYNKLVIFKNNNQSFEVRLREKIGSLENYFYLDFPISSRSTLGNRPANVYKASGYCDGPSCGNIIPFMAYVTDGSNYFYHLVFYGDVVLSESENQILATFKFTDSVVGVFCGGVAAMPCPSGYSCKLEGSDWDATGPCIKNAVACTQEAKQCSDGSYVGRTGPNCEFAACPK